MLQENLQINIGANTQDLQAGLNQATNSVNNFSNSVQKAVKPTGDATQSLTNLSRIAQDAPYGFMGIANNLNPLLESFQRLQKESGGAGEALKAMAAGLMGPAGIGLALGAVSSLLVAYGDKIGDFIAKTLLGNEAMEEQKTALAGVGGEFTSAVEKVNKVGIAFEEYRKGIISGKEALKVYNDELGKNFGVKSNINEAEKAFKDKTAAYVEASFQRALADSASKKAAEELLKERLKQAEGPKNTVMDMIISIGQGGATKETLNKVAASNLKKEVDESEKLIATYKKIAQDAKEASDTLAKSFQFETGKGTKPSTKIKDENNKASEKIEEAKSLEQAIKDAYKFIDNEQAQIVKGPKEPEAKSNKVLLNALTGETGEKKDDNKLAKDKKEMDKFFKDNEKNLEQAKKSAEGFADTLSKNITGGLMSMWDAMEKGENPLKALGNFFKDLIKQLAAAVVQAILFQTIMSALGFGAVGGAAKGAGGLLGGIGKIFGFAEGGIVSQPTMAMVGEGGQSEAIMPLNKLGNMMNSTFNAGAMSGGGGGKGGNGQFTLKGNDLVLALQRSNYSLNLRRGS